MPPSTPPQRRLHLLSTVATALLVRLVVVLPMLRNDPKHWFYSQATELGHLAASLVNHQGLSSPFGGSTGPSAFLAPGYPAIVAFCFRFFGVYSKHAAVALILLQIAFGVLTVLTIMLATHNAFGIRAANIAGAIWAIAPPLLYIPSLFWETGLSILLLTALFALVLAWYAQPKLWQWTVMGAYCALAMLVNPSLAVALVSIIAWATWSALRSKQVSLAAPLLAVVVFAVIFAPWPRRNQHTMHAFIPMRSNMGYELWQGNRGSHGNFSPALHPNVNRDEFDRYNKLGEVAYMQEKSSLATEAIRSNPSRFLGLTVLRSLKFWVGLGSQGWSALIVTYITLTSALGLAGLVILWRKHRSLATLFLLPLLVFPLPYYITHPDFRFRLVLDPILTMLTAYAIVRWLVRNEARKAPPQQPEPQP